MKNDKSHKVPTWHLMIIVEGKGHISSQYFSLLQDESKLAGSASMLFFPEELSEIPGMFNMYFKDNAHLTISGGRTGIVGGAVPENDYIVSTERLKRMSNIVYDETKKCFKITLEAGVTLDELNSSINKYNKENGTHLFFPVNTTETLATFGGMVSTNASGSRTFRFGNMRNYILGLKVFFKNGKILELQRGQLLLEKDKFVFYFEDKTKGTVKIKKYKFNKLKKNNAGYYYNKKMELIDMFIGSEGDFGLIGEVTLKLIERDEVILDIVSFFQNKKNTLDFVEKLREDKRIYAIEYFDRNSLSLLRKISKEKHIPHIKKKYKYAIYLEYGIIEKDEEKIYGSLEKLLKKLNSNIDDTWIGDNDEEIERLSSFRHLIPEIINEKIGQLKNKIPQIHKISTDSAVPQDKLKEYMRTYERVLEESKLEYYVFGHIGDSHLHINIIPKTLEELKQAKDIYELLMKKSVQLGGTISAEHGTGKIKKEYLKLMYTKTDLKKMEDIKKQFENLK